MGWLGDIGRQSLDFEIEIERDLTSMSSYSRAVHFLLAKVFEFKEKMKAEKKVKVGMFIVQACK